MEKIIEQVFNEAIRMELNVAALYRLYERFFPEDGEFWNRLVHEEENHAAVIESGRNFLFDEGLFPLEALDPDLKRVQEINTLVEETIASYKRNQPLLDEALRKALEFEGSTVEYYYQYVAQLLDDSPAVKLFQELSEYSESHGKRIIGLMGRHGVELHS